MQNTNVETALDKASHSAHAAFDSLATTANEAVSKAGPAIDRVAAKAHEAVDKAAGVAAPGAEWLANQADELSAAPKKLMADTCSYVAAHPLQSLGLALLAGYLLSRVTR
jgi:ElaB/YqjD/DUF883 family membrane-anchored ribosome-binding protein